MKLKVTKCPSDELSFTNCVFSNSTEPTRDKQHICVLTGNGVQYIFTQLGQPDVPPGCLGFSMLQRKWAALSVNQEIECKLYKFSHSQYLSSIVLEADFLKRNSTTQEAYDSDRMANQFSAQFAGQAFSVGQLLAFSFEGKKELILTVKSMQVADLGAIKEGRDAAPLPATLGLLLSNSTVQFQKADQSSLNITGKSKGSQARQSLINPDWDFNKMGIGGLDNEFNAIFRRAFASRVFPPEVIEQLGCKHVKGILLFGPPGTGKTLLARQIGQMLNAREPKIVNGPQILDKYVGESEANIRKLFADAEEEEEKMGVNSGLHIIIFDELDAICKQRGSVSSGSAVHDTIVNQLLSKIDGVKQLNNILVIGMTNRKDMIDEALLRPGRLEVQVEIGLPDEHGRVQILNIHTAKMRKSGKLGQDVDIAEIAHKTKNFSGAEIEGLVRAAQSSALNRLIKPDSKVTIDADPASKISVQRADFEHALENDIKPAFGTSSEMLDHFMPHGIIGWGASLQHVIDDALLFIQQARSPVSKGIVTLLLDGPPNSGKTALAAHLARLSEFPFIKVCTPEDMVGYSETAKVQTIKKLFDDAYRSSLSCLLVDNIERLLDYTSVGPRFSNVVLQALLVLLKKEPPRSRKLLVLCTSSRRDVMEEMDMLNAFTAALRVPNLSTPAETVAVLRHSGLFSDAQLHDVERKLTGKRIFIGIRKLLALVEMSREVAEKERVWKLLCRLEEDGHTSL